MASICDICGKGPIKGSIILRRGKPKSQGGIGQHVTAISKRRFLPNIQKTRVLINGGVRSMNVCSTCLKRGKVVKAPHVRRGAEAKPETVAVS
jgi:large subunit ribosomal protein L28